MDEKDSSDKINQMEQTATKPAYTIQGILHFIQHEWSKFEMERSQWEVERAELQAKVAFLEGERKGQENLKRDLIRRIKMLEFALKQERIRHHKLKFGTDLNLDLKNKDSSNEDIKISTEFQPMNPSSLRQGRQLLRQYLQEVGYSDTILDIRSQRVRSLLSNYNENKVLDENVLLNGANLPKVILKRSSSSNQQINFNDDVTTTSPNRKSDNDVISACSELDDVITNQDEENLLDLEEEAMTSPTDEKNDDADDVTTTNEVLSQFDFLTNHVTDIPPTPPISDERSLKEWPSVDQQKIEVMKEQFQKEKRTNKRKGSKRPVKKDLQNMLQELKGSDVIMTGSSSAVMDDNVTEEDTLPFTVGGCHNDESIENALGLGDLAGLTVANEADVLCLNVNASKEPFRKMWNPKYTLRSHFDGVRDVIFLPDVNGVITASEDQTLKLWNLDKPATNKRSSSLDLDPIYSFRGHQSAVLCCAVNDEGSICFSGGIDSNVRTWSIPSVTSDPFEKYDSSVAGSLLTGHTDAVWSLSYSGISRKLLSASSDMTIRLWNPESSNPSQDSNLHTYTVNTQGAPTCVEFVKCDSNQAVVSHTDGKIAIYDLETGKIPTLLQDSGDDDDRVNCVVTHPTMPITISAHDDRQIKVFDNTSGKKIHQMVAHLDVVSSLAVDPNGLYLLSGSHDCSIRLWNLDTKTCIQELTSHRKKFDESIYSVAFHPTFSYIASAGADALVKIFE